MLTGRTIILYLFGHAESIRRVASAQSALATGIILVILTSIARNYDQTHLSENPMRWLFGSLLFSLVSGMWLFLVSYCGFARRRMALEDKRNVWSHWPQFMSLFWMTAPVAWLYAIPVEGFMDPVEAAKANLVLLAIVALWRVLLMARALQVTCTAPFGRTLLWVLFPAAVEAVVISLFGGMLAQSILRGMGGLRYSPAEEVILNTLKTMTGVFFWTAPVLLLAALLLPPRTVTKPLPVRVESAYPWAFLGLSAVLWVGVAIPNQVRVARNVHAETLAKEDRMAHLLAFYDSHSPSDFAPSRVLPPRAYERDSIESIARFVAALDGQEAPWIMPLVLEKLSELELSLVPMHVQEPESLTESARLETIYSGFLGTPDKARLWIDAIQNLEEFPAGRTWLQTKPFLLKAFANEAAGYQRHDAISADHSDLKIEMVELLDLLTSHGIEPQQEE